MFAKHENGLWLTLDPTGRPVLADVDGNIIPGQLTTRVAAGVDEVTTVTVSMNVNGWVSRNGRQRVAQAFADLAKQYPPQ